MSKKIVHVLGKMDAGGVESWLVNLLKNTDKTKIQHEFLLQKPGEGFYDNEIKEIDGKLAYCLNTGNPLTYMFNLFKYLKKSKPDVVHSHVYTFSGLVLLVAFLANIEIRVSHSHNDMLAKERKSSFIKKIYLIVMKFFVHIFSTEKIAVSEYAAQSLYGKHWRKKNVKIMPCTIDLSKFYIQYKDQKLRANLGIPDSALVLGHVGSFSEQKNHTFLIDVFFEVRKRNSDAYLVLVGDGDLRSQIEKKVTDLELNSKVLFLGLRKDVPIVMMSVFDVFVFPSLWEGLGLVAVEAQSAGIPCLLSNNIPKEADVGACRYLELVIDDWVDAIINKDEINLEIENTRYDIHKSINFFNKIYRSS